VIAPVVPTASYGVVQRETPASVVDEVAETVRRLGYAKFDSGYTAAQIATISSAFDAARAAYVQRWTQERLRALDEQDTLRAMCTHGGPAFVQLACNPVLLEVLQRLIGGKFILNQQNGVINPPAQRYNQGAWHRDLPYQHFVSTSPLAINALFCVDSFTQENGATFVLPASHKAGPFPSEAFVRDHAVQVEARAGEFILLDCMTFHSGGFNRTDRPRRAVNHVFTIPMVKQQIKLTGNIDERGLTPEQKSLFGFEYPEPASVEAFLESRVR
jgi:ectoine hydroxylase-related dioxygenase (phytanoyl-CoA dioxygenase family)